jgi:hypothetical protein
VAAWSAALIKTGRPMWFTLSWYLNPDYGSYWRQYANAMRANGDVEWPGHDKLVNWTEPPHGLRARWLDITQTLPQWQRTGQNHGAVAPLHRRRPADMDSLDVGVGSMDALTEDERQSYMTLWVICSSPLYTGDDIAKLDSFGLALLTNPEVIAVNQAGLVPKAKGAASRNPVWWSKNADGSYNVALFNLNDSRSTASIDFTDLGFSGRANVRNLWARKNLPARKDSYKAVLAPHACQLIKLTAI